MKINRRKLLSLLGVSPAILAGSTAAGDRTKKKTPETSGQVTIEALNPRGIPPAIQLVPMAPRLGSLEGKTIYLVSDGFPGADRFWSKSPSGSRRTCPVRPRSTV